MFPVSADATNALPAGTGRHSNGPASRRRWPRSDVADPCYATYCTERGCYSCAGASIVAGTWWRYLGSSSTRRPAVKSVRRKRPGEVPAVGSLPVGGSHSGRTLEIAGGAVAGGTVAGGTVAGGAAGEGCPAVRPFPAGSPEAGGSEGSTVPAETAVSHPGRAGAMVAGPAIPVAFGGVDGIGSVVWCHTCQSALTVQCQPTVTQFALQFLKPRRAVWDRSDWSFGPEPPGSEQRLELLRELFSNFRQFDL